MLVDRAAFQWRHYVPGMESINTINERIVSCGLRVTWLRDTPGTRAFLSCAHTFPLAKTFDQHAFVSNPSSLPPSQAETRDSSIEMCNADRLERTSWNPRLSTAARFARHAGWNSRDEYVDLSRSTDEQINTYRNERERTAAIVAFTYPRIRAFHEEFICLCNLFVEQHARRANIFRRLFVFNSTLAPEAKIFISRFAAFIQIFKFVLI